MAMTITFPGGKKVDASWGKFTIHTDQHPTAGGEGTAPEPYSYFLASIGTCAGIYVLGFCQSRGIPTEGLRLVQNHEFDPKTHRLAKVRLDIEVPPGFPERYLGALKLAADQCAVKRTLFDPPEFEITAQTSHAALGATPAS
jgi:ribosomal protein S12 methylthiotransferase accessory factor